MTLSLVCLLFALETQRDVLVLQGLEMAVLLLGREGVEVSSFHVQEVLRVLADDIDARASRKISEGDTESMDEDRINHSLAARAFV